MRKEVTVTFDDRGKKLTFIVREMSARNLERWGLRTALLLVGAAGSDASKILQGNPLEELGKFFKEHGVEAIARLDYDKAEPLLDELLGCCSRVIGNAEEKLTPENVDACIEDASTLLKLRWEALCVNFSFLSEDAPSDTPSEATQSPVPSASKISVS